MLGPRLAALLALPLVILGAGGLVVDTASPDALCPPIGPTRELVASRLGDVELEGTWRATYVLVHRSEGDFVVLSLRDPNGEVRLERQFPVRGGSCGTLSQMIALVLERYFLKPGGESREDGAPPAEPAPAPAASTDAKPESSEPEPRSGPETSDRATTSPASSVETAPGTRPSAAAWSVDAGLWVTNAWLSPSARLSRRMTGPLWLGLGVGVDLMDHEAAVGEGWVGMRRIPISLFGSVSFGSSSQLKPLLGVEVLGLFEQAWTRDLDEAGGGARLVPGLGLRAGADFLSSEKAGPFAELTGTVLFRSASPAFEVDHRAVAVPPTLVFGAVFGIRAPF